MQTQTLLPSRAGGLVYVGLEHIEPGSTTVTHPGVPGDVRSAKTRFRPNEILYGKLRPYLDKAALAQEEGICSTDILVLRARDGYDPGFMAFLLHTAALRRHASATTSGLNHPRTSWSKLRSFEFAKPSLDEQRAIAHVLHTVQRAKEQTDQAIGASQQVRDCLEAQLFTYGPVAVDDVCNTRTKRMQFGQIPEHWAVAELQSVLLELIDYRGKTPKKLGGAFSSSGIPVISALNVKKGAIALDSTPRFVSEELYERWMSKKLRPGDALLTSEAPLGQVGRIPNGDRYCLGQRLFGLRADPTKLDERYLLAVLRCRPVQRQLHGRARGTTAQGISQGELRKIVLPLPSLRDQVVIADMFEAIDKKIRAGEQRREALDQLFKTLLHELMTGRIRLTDWPEVA